MQPNPQTLLENLIALLGEEAAIYTDLATLLEAESTALLKLEIANIAELASCKETLALRLKGLDESRKLIARRLAQLLGVPATAITVRRLATAVKGIDGERLMRAADRLKELVLRCEELNTANTRAAKKGLELTGNAMEYLLGGSDPAGKVYQPTAGRARGYAASNLRPGLSGPGLISSQA